VYGATRKAVADKLVGIQADIRIGRPVPDDRQLLGAFLDDWLDMIKANREHSTWEGYEQRVRLHIKPALGQRPLTKVTAADVQRLPDQCRRKGLSPRSVAYVRATMRAALGVAERWGLVSRNGAELTEPVTVHRREVQPFTLDEVGRLLDACRGDRLGALFTVAMAIGLRPGEALGLRWVDVDLDAAPPVVRVQHSLKKGPGGRLVFGAEDVAADDPARPDAAPRVVMEVLGHSTYQLTMDTYSHVMPTLLQGAADVMDDVLGGVSRAGQHALATRCRTSVRRPQIGPGADQRLRDQDGEDRSRRGAPLSHQSGSSPWSRR